MSVKKSIILLLFIGVLLFSGKASLTLSAAENSGYVVLINDDNSSISFAGVNYALRDDLKTLSLEFQIMDSHTFKGNQGIRFSIICGDKRDEIFIDSALLTRSDDSFFSLNNTLNEIDVFSSHSNVKISFEILFSKKLTENLILEAEFIDAAGGYSQKATCVLYDSLESSTLDAETDKVVFEETEKTRKPNKTSEKTTTEKAESETSASTKHTVRYSYSPYVNSSSSVSSYTQKSTSPADVSVIADTESAVYENISSNSFGAQQIIAIVLAALLIAAAFVCVVLGIKKSKVS